MKKSTLLYLFLILGFVLLPNQSLASSGACSYHGGVNCSVEATNGDAICNDNTVSSVSYSSMIECEQLPTCQYPSCSVDSIQAECTQEQADLNANLGDRGLGGSSIAAQEGGELNLDCSTEISACQSATNDYNTCMAESSAIKTQISNYQNQQLAQPAQTATPQPIQQAGISDSSCKTEFGGAAYADVTSNTCLCNTGYSMQNAGGSTQCVALPAVTASVTPPAPSTTTNPLSLPSLPIIDFSKYKISIPSIAPKTTTASTSTSPASTTVVIEATATSSTIVPQQAPAKPTGFFTKIVQFFLHLF